MVDLIPRSVLWFWGHEDRLAAFDAHQKDGGILAIGRCVGHGGMPVERDPSVTDKDCPLKFFDNRPDPDHTDINVGFNGCANLQFTSESLTVSYRDRLGVEVLHDEWVVSNGSPSLVLFRPALAAGVPVP